MSIRKSLALLAGVAVALPAGAAPTSDATLDLSLEELMSVVVTSVSRKSQSLGQTAAAVHVIQAEDIRRSGATSIPEALRLAPGVQVSAIGQNKWAVSIRGFADRFSNKLLVMVDGRSVYSPLFSGVLWEALDVPLENIARIEVVRGPGASIWGANAVNGVINIITKAPGETVGTTVAAAAGSELRGYGFARRGWNVDRDTAAQVYAKVHDYGPSQSAAGGAGADDWRNVGTGFKLEHLMRRGTLNVQGGFVRTAAGDELRQVSAPPANAVVRATERISVSHLLARWDHEPSQGRRDSLQAYVEHSDYDHVIIQERRTTADLEFQQNRRLGARHDLIWGLGARYTTDSIENSPVLQVDERRRDMRLLSAYAHDDITLVPERWRATIGARLEHNGYTGFSMQPNVRLLWTPDARNSAWLSLARAVRTPSRIERGGATYLQADPVGMPPFLPPSVVQLVSLRLGNERVDALDFGWRRQFGPSLAIDLSGFVYAYDRLRGAAATPPVFLPEGYLLVRMGENTANSARMHGVEASVDWRPAQHWRLQAAYSWLGADVRTASTPGQVTSDADGTSPTHQVSLRASWDASQTVRADAWLRFVSGIRAYDVPAFTTLDLRVAWRLRKNLEVSVVGQNLLDQAHREFGSLYFTPTPTALQRGAFLRVDWKP